MNNKKIYNDINYQKHVKEILESIDDNSGREGLKDTPRRYLKFLYEFTRKPKFKFTVFDSEGMDEMIIQSNIPFTSLCEHHICPFTGYGHIAYIPNGKIVGLSKIARTLDYFSAGLQNQERITMQVADLFMKKLKPKGVAVFLEARHSCMEIRGVKKHDTWTKTSCLRGIFLRDSEVKNEFFSLIKK